MGLSDSACSCAAAPHHEMQNGHMVVVTFSSSPWIHPLLGCFVFFPPQPVQRGHRGDMCVSLCVHVN